MRENRWASSVYEQDRSQVANLQGATVGIVGYGHIGSRVSPLMRAFGARVAAVSRSPIDNGEGLPWSGSLDDLEQLLTESDVIVLCLPLTDQTRGLIGSSQLDTMGPDAVLVNVSRGPLVDEVALYEALAERRLGGAVLDVWYQYPAAGSSGTPSTRPFANLTNVLMTPHISGVTRQTFDGRVSDITANIRRLAAGQDLRNVVVNG